MPDSRVKKSIRRGNPKKMAVRLGVLLVALYVIVTLVNQQGVINSNSVQANALKSQISQAQGDTGRLNAELVQIGSDSYIERVARQKLGLVKPGEKIFVDSTKR